MQRKISITTLGCRLNIAESSSILDGFLVRGFLEVPIGENADYIVINTCTVTSGADSTCRNLIRKAHKNAPNAKIIVIGCYAQLAGDEIQKMPGVFMVLGTKQKHKIFEYLDLNQESVIDLKMHDYFVNAKSSTGDHHTRGFLKVQEGCNYFCSYCIIPYARGNPTAISIDDAVSEAKKLVDNGFLEIVLTGINVGEYASSNKNGDTLGELLDALSKIDGLKRLRLSSLEPNTITKELVSLVKDRKNIMPYFHLPLQSGSDNILRLMGRRYTLKEFQEIVLNIKKEIPHAGIGTDIILGFPSETEEDFLSTKDFVKELPLTHFHVFPYSIRHNTPAAKMKGQIEKELKNQRAKVIREIGESKHIEFLKSQIGIHHSVLFEELNDQNEWSGYTENYLKVTLLSNKDLKNKIIDVKINDFTTHSLKGTVTNE